MSLSRSKWLLTAILVATFVGSFWARSRLTSSPEAAKPASGPPKRIISMAPSLTETLFALGLGDRLVGVSRYCEHPPEVKKIGKIGGLADPDLERIVALRPDLIVVLASSQRGPDPLQSLGMPMLVVDHRDVEGMLDSITTIGQRCQAEDAAAALLGDMRARLERIRKRSAALPPVRTLMVVDRTGRGSGRLQDLYAAANHPYFNAILKLAGGRNALADTPVPIPLITVEGILQADPEVILDLVPPASDQSPSRERLLADWELLRRMNPGAGGRVRVHVLDEPYAQVPGPRFILLVEKIAGLLHPELNKEPPTP